MNAPTPAGHNLPEIKAPDLDLLKADLEARYPEVASRTAELLKSADAMPEKIDDEETASAATALVRMLRAAMSQFDATKKVENEPWRGLVAEVNGFFVKPIEKLKERKDKIEAELTVFLERQKEKKRLEAEEAAKRQREEAARLQREAEAAEARRREAERAEQLAREREEKARQEADAAERRRKDAEEAATLAKAEEDRLAREKREREKSERQANADGMKDLKALMKMAERLHTQSTADATPGAADRELAEMLRHGNQVATIGLRLRDSSLLDDDQRAELDTIRARIREMREALQNRAEDAERAEREERHRQEEEAAAARAEEQRKVREAQRVKDEAAAEIARAGRAKAEAEAEEAKAAAKAAKADVKDALAEQRDARGDQKDAARTERLSSAEALRTENRAVRSERRLDETTDAELSRHRGDHGTVGSLASRWEVVSVDFATVDLEALRPFLLGKAIEAAAFRYMQEAARTGVPKLRGAVFERVSDAKVSG